MHHGSCFKERYGHSVTHTHTDNIIRDRQHHQRQLLSTRLTLPPCACVVFFLCLGGGSSLSQLQSFDGVGWSTFDATGDPIRQAGLVVHNGVLLIIGGIMKFTIGHVSTFDGVELGVLSVSPANQLPPIASPTVASYIERIFVWGAIGLYSSPDGGTKQKHSHACVSACLSVRVCVCVC